MPTQNPRVNITLDARDLGVLMRYAKGENKSVSSAAKELILLALELQEDRYFSTLSERRIREGGKRIPHTQAWK